MAVFFVSNGKRISKEFQKILINAIIALIKLKNIPTIIGVLIKIKIKIKQKISCTRTINNHTNIQRGFMESEIIVALITLTGSAIGTIGGILATNRLTSYRIEQLEKKVDKHNRVVERMYEAEKKISVISEEIKVANHRIEDIEHLGGK